MEEKTDFSSFTNYKQTVIEITNDMKNLRDYSEQLKLKGNVSAIDGVLKRLTEDNFNVAIVGEFNRGKSTIINALLGKDILPMDILPTTATLNKITYSVTPFVKIFYKDGRSEDIQIDQLKSFVTKLDRNSEEKAKTIQEAVVYYPVNYCKNGVTIIDTPGLNDEAAMNEVTMSVLPQTDAALMILMAQAPFSDSERDFLESRIISSDLGRVMFVVTGIDQIDEEDVDRVLKNIASRIQEHVITKAENSFGKDSKEFEAYKQKIGSVHVFGVSAKKALKAKLKCDDEMLTQSCFPTFENALEKFLTEDRGAITLSVPVNRIKTSSIEIIKAIELREGALAMQKDEFDKKYDLAIREIENVRKNREIEFGRINETSQRTFADLVPAIKNYWPSVQTAASDAIDSVHLTPEEANSNSKETQERLTRVVKNAMTKVSQQLSERIQETINGALKDEAERLSGFENSFFEATDKIQDLFTVDVKTSTGTDVVISSLATGMIGFGIGGVYMGFKEAGWKGGLLGGATGFVGFAAVKVLAVALAVPATWPVLLITCAVAGLVSTFTSKWAIGKLFPDKAVEKYKNNFKAAVEKEIANMRAQENFSENVRTQVDNAFTALKEKLRIETENILTDTQNQLTALKIELTQQTVEGDKEKQDLKKMLVSVSSICNRADELGKQLTVVLNR